MMDGKDYRFEKNDRVKLRDIPDPDFYQGMATLGNEGWIIKRRRDQFGLPEVYVRWDTNHWTYNGVQDCWTYQEHFDQVEVRMPDMDDSRAEKIRALTNAYGEQLADLLSDQQAPKKTEEAPQSGVIDEIRQKLEDSEAFVVIGVRRDPVSGQKRGKLIPWIAGLASEQLDSDALLAAQASAWASKGHEDLVVYTLSQMNE